MNKLLITGASGFVGDHLVTKILESLPDVSIIATYCTNPPKSICDHRVRYVKVDFHCDDFSDLLDGVDIIFHLAAYSYGDFMPKSMIHEMYDLNVNATINLAKLAKQQGVSKFIFISSISACESSSDKFIDENNGLPVTAYGKSKKIAEEKLLEISDLNFIVQIFRPVALFGENHKGSMFELVIAVKDGYCIIFGDGKNNTNFLYVKDFVDIVYEVGLYNSNISDIINVSDECISLIDLVRLIKYETRSQIKILFLPKFIGYILGLISDLFNYMLINKKIPFSSKRYRAMVSDKVFLNNKLKMQYKIQMNFGITVGVKNSISDYLLKI